jgi:hypothetical protein
MSSAASLHFISRVLFDSKKFRPIPVRSNDRISFVILMHGLEGQLVNFWTPLYVTLLRSSKSRSDARSRDTTSFVAANDVNGEKMHRTAEGNFSHPAASSAAQEPILDMPARQAQISRHSKLPSDLQTQVPMSNSGNDAAAPAQGAPVMPASRSKSSAKLHGGDDYASNRVP